MSTNRGMDKEEKKAPPLTLLSSTRPLRLEKGGEGRDGARADPESSLGRREAALAQRGALAARAGLRFPQWATGQLWPLRLPSFQAVGDLPVAFTCNRPSAPTSEPLTRPLPSSGRLAAAAGLSPFLTSSPLARLASAAARRPEPCLSPQPGAPVSVLLPLSSVHPGLFPSLLFP